MEVSFLVKSILGLVVILGILILLFVLPSENKTSKEKIKPSAEPKKEGKSTDLKSLSKIIKNFRTTRKDLEEALDLVIKHHGKIHPKLGSRTHPDFDIYMEILFTICHHPKTNKNIILKFNRELEILNPEYKHEIGECLIKGLDSRKP